MHTPASSASLLAAMETNFVTHVAWLPARLPGARVLDGPDLLLVDSGLATDTFNVVCRARFRPAEVHRRAVETCRYFEQVGRPFAWWVGPLDQPAALGAALRLAGLVADETEEAMVADLGPVPAAPPMPAGLRIERVRQPAGVRDYAAVVAANWSPADPWVLAYYAAASGPLLTSESPCHLYVGYLAERPVAAAELCLSAPIAGVYGVCTLAAVRGRGVASALVAQVLLDARTAGAAVATLQASAQGQSVYQRLGFRALGQYTEFKPPAHWAPSGSGATLPRSVFTCCTAQRGLTWPQHLHDQDRCRSSVQAEAEAILKRTHGNC